MWISGVSANAFLHCSWMLPPHCMSPFSAGDVGKVRHAWTSLLPCQLHLSSLGELPVNREHASCCLTSTVVCRFCSNH